MVLTLGGQAVFQAQREQGPVPWTFPRKLAPRPTVKKQVGRLRADSKQENADNAIQSGRVEQTSLCRDASRDSVRLYRTLKGPCRL